MKFYDYCYSMRLGLTRLICVCRYHPMQIIGNIYSLFSGLFEHICIRVGKLPNLLEIDSKVGFMYRFRERRVCEWKESEHIDMCCEKSQLFFLKMDKRKSKVDNFENTLSAHICYQINHLPFTMEMEMELELEWVQEIRNVNTLLCILKNLTVKYWYFIDVNFVHILSLHCQTRFVSSTSFSSFHSPPLKRILQI